MKEMKQRTQLFSVLLVACIWVGMSLTAVAQTTDPIQPYLSAPSNVPRMIVCTATEDVTAERIWEYRHPQDLYTPVIANMQTLPNGNSLISWGVSDMNDTNSNILATEVTPDNEVAFEFGLDVGAASYRVIRASWVGNPAAPPVLDVSVGSDQLTFYMSWNGTTEHHTYRIYEGEQGLYENRIAEVERTGFEMIATVDLPPRDGDYFYRIEALDAAGTVLGTSRTDSVHIGDTTIFLPLVHTQLVVHTQ